MILTRTEARLSRIEATLFDREVREGTRAVLRRLQAVEAQRALTSDEIHQQIAALVDLCGGTVSALLALARQSVTETPRGE